MYRMIGRGWRIAVAVFCAVVVASCSAGRQTGDGEAGMLTFDVPHVEAVQLTPEARQKYNALFLESVRQGLKGNDAAAYELLCRALELNPDGAESLSRLAYYVTDTAKVVSMLKHAIAVAPENATYRLQLVYSYLQRTEYDSAIAVLRTAIDREDYPVDDLWMLYRLQGQQGYYEAAGKTLDRLERLEGGDEYFSYERIRLYLSAGQPEEAYKVVENLCEENPTELRYFMLLASLYLDNGRADEGYAICREVQAKEPGNKLAQIWLLSYYEQQHDTTAFYAMLDSVIRNPEVENATRLQLLAGHVGAYRNDTTPQTVGRILSLFRCALSFPQDDSSLAELWEQYMMYAHQPDDSVKVALYKNLSITPDNSAARTRLLLRLIEDDDGESIISLCREGELYNPTHLHYYLYEALALAQKKLDQEAIEVLLRGLEYKADNPKDGNLISSMYAVLGDLFHSEKRKEESYAAYDSCLVYNPDNLGCLNNYAYFLSLDRVRLDEAERMSLRTVRKDSLNPTYLDTYAWILYETGRYEQARLYIDETLKYVDETEDNSSIYDHAGDIYLKCGLTREAVDFWNQALRMTTDADERKEIESKIKKYSHL